MFLTNVLLKRAKSKSVMVLMESVVSGHKFVWIRERLADKLELLRWDPYIRTECIYKEVRKVRTKNWQWLIWNLIHANGLESVDYCVPFAFLRYLSFENCLYN